MKPQPQVPLTKGPKKYYLTTDERTNLDNRQQLIKQKQYEMHAINTELQAYVYGAVMERLGLRGKEYILNPDNTFLTVKEDNEPNPSQTK